jgi:autotransporter passenger strand-loop-strand repeat protein
LDATALFMGVTVTAGQTYNVSSGQTDSGDIVDNGCTLNVLSGGAISATQDSGTLYVSAGGTATDTVVLNSVLLNVYGSATGTIVYGSGLEIVYSGGIAIGTVVNVGAQVVEFGGTELNPTINSSRDQAIYGVASGTVVNSGSNEYVYSGGTAIGTVVNNDNHGGLDVFSGGTAIGTTVNSESVLTVYGFASSSIVNGGGCEFVSGGTAIGTVVESGGQETVQYSGTALGTVVDGNQFVEIGGTVSGAVVNNDGALNVLGTISNTQDYGTVHVSSGGTAIGTVVNYGQEVDSGGIASGTVVNSGGVEVVYGGTANGTILNGTQYVPYGGTASGTVVNNKGVQSVQHATASGTVVNSGGELDLYYSDTVVTNAIVHNGGILGLGGGKVTGTLVMGGTFSGFTVSSGVTFEGSGGTVSKTTVLSGGTLELLAGAKQNGTTISSGGIFEIGSGETLSGYRVSRGITLEAALGGRVSNTTVLSGGTFAVLSGGMANGITVSRGGTATIASGAVVSGAGKVAATGNGATLAVEGDIFTVGSDGVVLGSGAQMDLEVGQVSGTLTIAPGATVNALSGASALLAPSGKSIANSGLIIVENGTTLTLSGTVINSGTLEVSATSSATALNLENAKISGGKLQTNGSNAVIETISGTNVIQGGTIVSGSLVEVTSGTRLSLNGGTIGKGATVETASSGTLVVSGTIINSGTLFARGANSTIAIIGVVKGGTAEVGDGVVDITKASGEAVTFQSGGTGGLVLNDATAYTGTLSGFGSGGNIGQFIDLTEVNIWSLHPLSYTPANAANTSGTLIVTDGTHSAHIKFVGTYTSASFTAINDGAGGVKITDPPVAQARIDLAQTGFGAHTTLGYSENNINNGGILSVKDGTHIAKVALLGNYMATSFVTAADGHGGTLITEAPQTTQQPLLSHPHA